MKTLNFRQTQILILIKEQPNVSFQAIYEQLKELGGERTIKRDLTHLVDQGLIITNGLGRSLSYAIPLHSRLFIPLSATTYAEEEPDLRKGVLATYQFSLWQDMPKSLFSLEQIKELAELTIEHQTKISQRSEAVRQKELERFIIELSWKSSRIEGNTYTLLDTERLIREGVPSSKNTKEETIMILNHKVAFDFIYNHRLDTGSGLKKGYVEEVHNLLMKGLLTDTGLRKHGVGITGSAYYPLDNQFQIQEALENCLLAINTRETVFDKALLTLLGISYIQPFVDGNKRTARLVANGLLLFNQAAPLSYRNVDEVSYRASLLSFYEQLSVVPMREIFIEQYRFAVRNYS